MDVRCCISGGGPAGMMLGLLLARAGVNVLVLEKHGDFLRDFRGNTIHPSTLEVMHELGVLDDLLGLAHQEVRQLRAQIGDETVTAADFSHLPVHAPFIAFMPQWDFLVGSPARRVAGAMPACPNHGARVTAKYHLTLHGAGSYIRARPPKTPASNLADCRGGIASAAGQ